MDYTTLLLQFVFFPGFLFTAVVGLVTSWIDRKVTARVQMRVGPPFLQPFYDIIKLMFKETIIPSGSPRLLFLSAPLLGLSGATLASFILWRILLNPGQSFMGDLIVLLYLLTLPAVAAILGSFASQNPLASLGGSREMKLIIAYELPFVLALLVPIIKAQSMRLGEILAFGSLLPSASGVLALIVSILCMQAKLTLVPFDLPEAETELTGGAFIEYSGPPLGLFKLTKAMMLFILPMFLVCVFWGGIHFAGGWNSMLLGFLKYIALIVIIVLIRNTAPRVRIDQAVTFFWGPVTGMSVIAILLAFWGW
ncbi:NADH-quinone oxidoreductase subunit H [candidate division FCPU426 bacterium]|nr:NADH-quinone oxidoreductase subunit H [candidate division FCPU426 bacterium]